LKYQIFYISKMCFERVNLLWYNDIFVEFLESKVHNGKIQRFK